LFGHDLAKAAIANPERVTPWRQKKLVRNNPCTPACVTTHACAATGHQPRAGEHEASGAGTHERDVPGRCPLDIFGDGGIDPLVRLEPPADHDDIVEILRRLELRCG